MQKHRKHDAPQWYPGHMAKARRMLQDNLKLIDLIIEVLDARIPISSQNPDFDNLFKQKNRMFVLSKSDLASSDELKKWIDYFKKNGHVAVSFNANSTKDMQKVIEAVNQSTKPIVDRFAKKGVKKTIRAIVAGIPNAGKSTLINRLVKGKPAAVGNKPGVTRGKQWVKVSPYLELLDTPGLLWPKLDNRDVAMNIAYVGSIKDDIMDIEALSAELLEKLYVLSPESVVSAYGEKGDMDGEEWLYEICNRRNWMQKEGVQDIPRISKAVIEDFRLGKLGRITLESPNDLV